MDKIAEIRSHLSAAEGDAATVSAHRWEAARLIWEVVNGGESQRGVADGISKSHTHVRYMYNSWDMVGRKLTVSGPEDLPDFQSVYNSDEVRGHGGVSGQKAVPEKAGSDSASTTDREPREGTSAADREPRDDAGTAISSGSLVDVANSAIGTLFTNRAFWQLLSGEDKIKLEEIGRRVTHILSR